MDINFSLSLPRDSATVPVVRRICRDALKVLGVTEDCTNSIELAVSEACTNVLKHVEGTKDEYEVTVQVTYGSCEIAVLDTGRGFDYTHYESSDSDGLSQTAEGGRGIFLMQAMVDRIEFRSEPEKGTIVHLVKQLAFEKDSILQELGLSATA